MAERIRRNGVASQNEIMFAVKTLSSIIPAIEDYKNRIMVLEEEVASLKAAIESKPKTTKAKTKTAVEPKTETETEEKETN